MFVQYNFGYAHKVYLGSSRMQESTIEEIAAAAKQIYNTRLKTSLEQSHKDEFLAIESESGNYFLGSTLSKALGAARRKYPDRLSHTIRVGHPAAVHFGLKLSGMRLLCEML